MVVSSRSGYDRFASFYEYGERVLELFLGRWRKILFRRIQALKVLEIGVGTGRSISYYRPGTNMIAGDLSWGMMRFARRKAQSRAMVINFCQFDVQNIPFVSQTFPAVLSSLVFCSVSDPLSGLREIWRVLQIDGRLYMIEHVRPDSFVAGAVFDVLNWFSVSLIGEHLNRNTSNLVSQAGFSVVDEIRCFKGVVRLLVAEKKLD